MNQLEERGLSPDKRAETRELVEDYYSVEFSVNQHLPVYQFRVRDLSPSGMGILIKEDSAALKRLRTGNVLEMKYNPANSSLGSRHLKTEIRHVTRLEEGRFKGHYLVGLRILDQGPDAEGGSAG
ncbi:MAG: PilZ domain-containing protein [Deltaproteobacteria bacterium]|nr:PilZ domain-containing protein [Deltaproteobacteria bacterium]